MVKIPRDFREFFALLNERNARYLVVGGYAVSLYGHPRFTGDIDIWIERSAENARRVVTAVREFGFNVPELTEQNFLDHDRITQMGLEPLRIEIFTHIPGVVFEDAYAQRNMVRNEDVTISFISLDDLKRSKQATNRPKDISDLDALP